MALINFAETLCKGAGSFFLSWLRDDRYVAQKNIGNHSSTQNTTGPIWSMMLTYLVVITIVIVAFLLPFDAELSRTMVHTKSSLLDVLRSITQLGLTGFYLALFASLWLVSFVITHLTQNDKMRKLALCIGQQSTFAVVTLLASGVLVNIIKHLIGRARPTLIDSVGAFYFSPMSFGYSFVSFPSGHSCTAGVMAVLLSLWFPRFKVPVFIVCALVALSRVAVKAHYPSDVLVGFTIGYIVTVVFARYLSRRNLFFDNADGKLYPNIIYNKNKVL